MAEDKMEAAKNEWIEYFKKVGKKEKNERKLDAREKSEWAKGKIRW